MAQPQQGSEVYDHLYKIILVGDATVGKTHLLSRYTRGTLPKNPKATIGVEFATRTVPLAVGGTVKAQVRRRYLLQQHKQQHQQQRQEGSGRHRDRHDPFLLQQEEGRCLFLFVVVAAV